MGIRVIQLGTAGRSKERLRLGTVRRPPRGVTRPEVARRFYDVWLPVLAPAPETIAGLRADFTDAGWRRFARAYRREMARPGARDVLALLAALSHRTALSVGCYCEDPARCHRSLLAELLREHGAVLDV